MKNFAVLTLCALLMIGCPEAGGPDPVTPRPAPHSDQLGAMCAHFQEMECSEGDDVYNDSLPGPVDRPNQSCEEFYAELQAKGVEVNPTCALLAPTCPAIEDYRAKDPKDCR